MIVRLALLIGLAVVLVLLWVVPGVLFPHPGVNDALELSTLGPLLYLLTLGASLLSLMGVGLLGWKAEGPVGLGAFLLGLAAAFVLAIITFGNFSNDRFAALLITPVLAVPVGGLREALAESDRGDDAEPLAQALHAAHEPLG